MTHYEIYLDTRQSVIDAISNKLATLRAPYKLLNRKESVEVQIYL